ncbi:bifunctional DNA primase/polymerase [Nocardia sp. NPDC059180]|uniref:bifunctional DNA primase/polymerase n=1 Tax=Nocardia sp. NPDC059180 TaxID=3346761 RepID=UPI00367DD068
MFSTDPRLYDGRNGKALPIFHLALDYAAISMEVFPLKPQSKVPATRNGMLDATTDPAIIRAWAAENPWYNIGGRPAPGIVVLDIDIQHGGKVSDLGTIPLTLTQRTGGGGYHFWFRAVGEARGKLLDATGIDIKTRNGYVVLAPSLHESYYRYQWLYGYVPIAPLPDHLWDRVMRTPPPPILPTRPTARGFFTDTGGSVHGLVRTVEGLTEGDRNNGVHWAFQRCKESGYAARGEEVEAVCEAARRVELDDNEIRAIHRSVFGGEA